MKKIKYIQAVNNNYGGLFEWFSENEHGLNFKLIKDHPGVIEIDQFHKDGDNMSWVAVARLTNFSIIQIQFYDQNS